MAHDRDLVADNMKGLLSILVVFGHMLDGRPYDGQASEWWLVQWIYIFHMPCFAYLSGMFTKYRKYGWVKYLYLYILWYLLECLCTGKPYDLFVPGFGLWYLLAMSVWPQMSLCIKASCRNVMVCFVIGILIGFVPVVGRVLSLSRIICFFPFYLMGFGKLLDDLPASIQALAMAICLAISILFAVLFAAGVHPVFLKTTFWMDRPYMLSNSSWWLRLAILFSAICFIITLRAFMTNKRVWGLTHIGQNTLPLYLSHLCIVGMLAPWLYSESLARDVLLAVLLTAMCCMVFTQKKLYGQGSPLYMLFDEKPVLESVFGSREDNEHSRK